MTQWETSPVAQKLCMPIKKQLEQNKLKKWLLSHSLQKTST
jgi:hypothetical protein